MGALSNLIYVNSKAEYNALKKCINPENTKYIWNDKEYDRTEADLDSDLVLWGYVIYVKETDEVFYNNNTNTEANEGDAHTVIKLPWTLVNGELSPSTITNQTLTNMLTTNPDNIKLVFTINSQEYYFTYGSHTLLVLGGTASGNFYYFISSTKNNIIILLLQASASGSNRSYRALFRYFDITKTTSSGNNESTNPGGSANIDPIEWENIKEEVAYHSSHMVTLDSLNPIPIEINLGNNFNLLTSILYNNFTDISNEAAEVELYNNLNNFIENGYVLSDVILNAKDMSLYLKPLKETAVKVDDTTIECTYSGDFLGKHINACILTDNKYKDIAITFWGDFEKIFSYQEHKNNISMEMLIDNNHTNYILIDNITTVAPGATINLLFDSLDIVKFNNSWTYHFNIINKHTDYTLNLSFQFDGKHSNLELDMLNAGIYKIDMFVMNNEGIFNVTTPVGISYSELT